GEVFGVTGAADSCDAADCERGELLPQNLAGQLCWESKRCKLKITRKILGDVAVTGHPIPYIEESLRGERVDVVDSAPAAQPVQEAGLRGQRTKYVVITESRTSACRDANEQALAVS